jgi:hypothetical protein
LPIHQCRFPNGGGIKGLANLKDIDLNDTKIGDEGLAALKDLPALETLSLQRSKVTEAGIKAFQAGRPKVKIYH